MKNNMKNKYRIVRHVSVDTILGNKKTNIWTYYIVQKHVFLWFWETMHNLNGSDRYTFSNLQSAKDAVKKHVELENVLAQDGTVADTFEL